jgi:hypothetical protein
MTTMQARHIEQKPVTNMSFGQLLSYYSGNTQSDFIPVSRSTNKKIHF